MGPKASRVLWIITIALSLVVVAVGLVAAFYGGDLYQLLFVGFGVMWIAIAGGNLARLHKQRGRDGRGP